MKMRIGILFWVITSVFFVSCSNNRTYADMKKDQKKAIDKLISEKGLIITDTYPKNRPFNDKEFVKLDNGVYLHVIDSGNGNRAISGETTILMRCSVERMFNNDTAKYNLFDNYYQPIEFIYGQATLVINAYQDLYYGPSYNTPLECYYLSPGVESILQYVGENAEVKLIVPFDGNLGSNVYTGSTYQISSNYGAPLYYERVRFQFY